ncbi:MAG TPA: hypothetical protein VHI13_17925 [Candidatus Kapabacteria bacterium]|nr:hypothetical protein [Candidatus Kapabacteria bacterium]
MASQAFLLPISTLISPDDLPHVLVDLLPAGFLDSVLGSVFYRDLQSSTTGHGDTSFFSMTLVVGTKLEIDIAGSGFKLVVNPDVSGTGADQMLIPFSLSYQWKLLRFLRGVDLSTFSLDADGISEILHMVLPIRTEDLLNRAIGLFINAQNQLTPAAAIQVLIQKINAAYPQATPITVSNGDPVAMLLDVIRKIELGSYYRQNGISFGRILYDTLLAPAGDVLDAISNLYKQWAGDSVIATAKDFLLPKITASARFTAGIAFPPDILVPVNETTYVPTGSPAVMTFGEADVTISTETGISIDSDIDISVPFSRIGSTNFYVRIDQAKLDLSRTTNISAVSGDGRPVEFVGAYVERAEIEVHGDAWSRSAGQAGGSGFRLIGKKMIIGTGGVSGTITLEAVQGQSGPFKVSLFGFDLELTSFQVTLSKNEITACSIGGKLLIPRSSPGVSETEVDILIGYKSGQYTVTANVDPPLSFGIDGFFNMSIKSLEVGEKNGRFFLAAGGTLAITADLPAVGPILDQSIEIRRLIIWSNGHIDFEGGSLVLPKSVSLSVGPVKLSVSNIHIGSDSAIYNGVQREYKFIGFDASVNTGVGGVDARGDGIKLYATVDGLTPHHVYLKMQGIHIHLHIPGNMPREQAAVLLDGFVSVKAGADSSPPQYTGGVKFELPQIHLKGGAQMALTPATGAYLVTAFLDLNTPIILGSTGLGIYGFQALFGNKYVLQKPDENTWWEYYKAPERGYGVTKFTQTDGFSIGAGVSFGTAADGGRAFSAKLGFIYSAPDVFVLQGQASILSKRVGLDSSDDPPFFASFALSRKSVEAAIGVNYHLPDPEEGKPDSGGEILKIDATMELAFFFGNASSWYINIGRDTPEAKRISATLLKILNGWAYLMLSSSGIRAGAGVSLKIVKDCGIAKVGLGASMEVGGKINFHPAQIGAWMKLMGYAELKVFGIGFRLTVTATLRGEAPHPFIIGGSFSIELDLPWPIPNLGLSVDLTWEFDPTPNLHEIGLFQPSAARKLDQYRVDGAHPVRAVHMLTGESFPVNFLAETYTPDQNQSAPAIPAPTVIGSTGSNDAPVNTWIGDFAHFTIPVDSFIDIDFSKPVKPNGDSSSIAKLGPVTTDLKNDEYVPPQPGHSPQVHHEYNVDEVAIYYRDGGAWLPYEMEHANSPLRRLLISKYPDLLNNSTQLETEVARRLKYGAWQLSDPSHYTRLRLLGRTPLGQNADVPPTELGFPPTVLLCPPAPVDPTCLDWEGMTSAPPFAAQTRVFDRKLAFRTDNGSARVVSFSGFDKSAALRIDPGNRIEFYFPATVTKVWMKVTTSATKATISYYRGYASAPPSSQQAGVSTRPNSWDAVPSGPSAGGGDDSFWEMMRAMPRFTRTLCSGTNGPDVNLAPVAAIGTLMSKSFAKTNYYLRQLFHLSAPAAAPTFCERLREMLGTVIVALAGKDRPPTALQQNVQYFYQDVKRYTDQYVSLLAESGEEPDAPPAPQNEFYEKWFDVVVCLGTLYDNRSTFPAYVQSMMTALVDPEVDWIYDALTEQANGLGVHMNQPAGQTDRSGKVRTIAEFFALLTLNLGAIQTATLTLVDQFNAPLYEPLASVVKQVRTALAGSSGDACGSGGGSASSCGGAWRDLIAIPRLLCFDTQSGSQAIPAILSLLNGFNDTIVSLEHLFGLDATSQSNSLCPDLRRALRVVTLALASPDALDGTLSLRVRNFYADLQSSVSAYEQDVKGQDLTGPTESVETFVTEWIDALECLCSICNSFGTLGADEQFFRDRIDGLYSAVALDAFTTGRPLSGAAASTNRCDQVNAIANMLTMLQTRCASAPTDAVTYLNDHVAAFEAGLVTFKAGKLAPFTGVVCNASGLSNDCNRLIEIVECLRSLLDRHTYLPDSVVQQMANDFNVLFSILSAVNALEHVVPESNGIILLPLDAPLDIVMFFVRNILANVYPSCLRGQSFPASVSTAVAGAMPQLESAFASLQSALSALDADSRVAICDSPHVDPVTRRTTLIANYRALCNVAPTSNQLATYPLANIITLMQNFAPMANQLASIYGLASVPASWPASDFCTMVARYVEILVIAYTDLSRVSPHQESEMLAFYNALQLLVADYSGSSAASGQCQTLCERWLAVFRCLARTCAVRSRLPADVFSDTGTGFEGAFGALLDGAYVKLLALADAAGATAQAGQGVGLCRKSRTIANYFAVRALDYANVDASGGLESIFTSYNDLRDAVHGTGTHGGHGRLCPPPVAGPYDPLMKRETRTRAELTQQVAYDNKDVPIDRITIVPAADCDTGQNAPCYTYVHEICWLAEADHVYNDDLPDPTAVRNATNDMLVALKDFPQPLWRPNTTYAVMIKTREVVSGGTSYTKYYTFGFRTAGPIGHFHEIGAANPPAYNEAYAGLVQSHGETEYKYANLKHYVDYERSYPNADGNIIGAKPLYYESAHLALYYRVDYMDTMFATWNQYQGLPRANVALKTVLLDPTMPASDAIVVDEPRWEQDPAPKEPKEFRLFKYMIQNKPNSDCATLTPLEQLDPNTPPPARRTVTPVTLEPNRMYAASFTAVFFNDGDSPVDREVHRYVFQTSRYRSLAEHIGSYLMPNDGGQPKKAIFDYVLPLGTDVATARTLIEGTVPNTTPYQALRAQYPLPYDALVNGVLRINMLPPAVTTEFTIVRESAGGPVLGILVRSPEPFNDPKLPAAEVAKGIVLTGFGAASDQRVIFSKDLANIFISTRTGVVATGTVQIGFQYRLFNGQTYDVATVLVDAGGGQFNEQTVPTETVTLTIT